jgi:Tol biopolymer transport system component
MTMTRPAIARLTVAVPLALAVLFSVPAQRGGAGVTIARAGMTSSLGANAPLHRMSNGKIAFFVGPDDPRLDVINPDGTGQKRLTLPCPPRPIRPGCNIKGYAWSPNGTRMAFVQGYPSRTGHNTMSLFVVNADGSGEKRLARCGQATGCNQAYGSRISWSPDGSRIVFSDRWSLYVVQANGGVLRRLTHGCTVTVTHSASGAITGWDKKSCIDISPAWSPDGSRIAFVRVGNTDSRLHVVNADGSGSKPLARLLGSVSDPVWSPDGGSIAFDAGEGIYTVHADGSHLKPLVSGSGPPGSGPGHPSWSPDGTRILYFSTPGYSTHNGGHYRFEVWVMNANGTGRRRLYHSACCTSFSGFPIWSPDGKYIAFDLDVSAHPPGIYLMDADGRHLHRLTQLPTLTAWQPIP